MNRSRTVASSTVIEKFPLSSDPLMSRVRTILADSDELAVGWSDASVLSKTLRLKYEMAATRRVSVEGAEALLSSIDDAGGTVGGIAVDDAHHAYLLVVDANYRAIGCSRTALSVPETK